jgi:4'-phosphopantetheinyl transferase
VQTELGGDVGVELVDLHLFDLDAAARELSYGGVTQLSHAERRRAAALLDVKRRRRFIAGRLALRMALGRALEVSPEQVRLRCGAHGKPELAPGYGTGLRFSLSHSDHLCLIVLYHGGQVGVDVQLMPSRQPWERLLERICEPVELEEARREMGGIGRLAFYERWVAKEAALKGLGCGLSVAPARVRLRRGADGALEFVELPGRTDAADTWRLMALQVPSGFVAALALADDRPLLSRGM